MLKAKALITFTLQGKDYDAHDRFDVAFRFDKELLFSGRIRSKNSEYINGKEYEVDISFFTIDTDENYNKIKHLLKPDSLFSMCAGSRIIGMANMLDFKYKKDR